MSFLFIKDYKDGSTVDLGLVCVLDQVGTSCERSFLTLETVEAGLEFCQATETTYQTPSAEEDRALQLNIPHKKQVSEP